MEHISYKKQTEIVNFQGREIPLENLPPLSSPRSRRRRSAGSWSSGFMERYHELSRSGDDVPLDYGASANELFFPDTLNDVLAKQLRKGDFIDAIFYCPYDIHELVAEEYLSKILWELNEEHKELLFLCTVRLFSSTRVAKIRKQSDRNIRKVRGTMLKKIRKKLLPALLDKTEKQQPMTLLEKDFLEESGMEIDSGEKKLYNG